jgi:uncharacterized membrane protein
MSAGRRVSLALLALLFVAAGDLHFGQSDFFVAMMPPWLPWPRELVYLSGAFEILGGLGVLVPFLRRAAGLGLIVLLVAVFPANIQMVVNEASRSGLSGLTVVLLLRLPLQFVLILWVYRATRPANVPPTEQP